MVSLSDQMEPRVLWERVADHSETAPLAVKPRFRKVARHLPEVPVIGRVGESFYH